MLSQRLSLAEERALYAEYEVKRLQKEKAEADEELRMARERVRRLEGKLKDGKTKHEKTCQKAMKLKGKDEYMCECAIAIEAVAKEQIR
jgi:predicted  nucleic acid-binding Zn-ribbon protein